MAKPGLFSIYNVYASTYDATFGRILGHRLGYAIRKLSLAPGMKVLDVGVGTGLTLEHYPKFVDVVGIDLSEGMLGQAEQRIREKGLAHTRVMVGNAQQMPFEDNSFDVVFMGHVLSVVDDPIAVLREAVRVGRPGATIMIVNRFQSRLGLIGRAEKALLPLFLKLGWRSDLTLAKLLTFDGVDFVRRERMFRGDIFDIVTLVSRKAKDVSVTSDRRRSQDDGRVPLRVL